MGKTSRLRGSCGLGGLRIEGRVGRGGEYTLAQTRPCLMERGVGQIEGVDETDSHRREPCWLAGKESWGRLGCTVSCVSLTPRRADVGKK